MKIRMKNNSNTSVNIDGRDFVGGNIVIDGNRVIVDGVVQTGELVGDINVTVNGDVETIQTASGNVSANNVGTVSTGSGDVECHDISGSVSTGSGDVDCSTVHGNIKTGSGDVNVSGAQK